MGLPLFIFCHGREHDGFNDCNIIYFTAWSWEGTCQVPFFQDASLCKWSIFGDCVGIAWTRQRLSEQRGNKRTWNCFRILIQSRKALESLMGRLKVQCKENGNANCLLMSCELHMQVKEKVLASQEWYMCAACKRHFQRAIPGDSIVARNCMGP